MMIPRLQNEELCSNVKHLLTGRTPQCVDYLIKIELSFPDVNAVEYKTWIRLLLCPHLSNEKTKVEPDGLPQPPVWYFAASTLARIPTKTSSKLVNTSKWLLTSSSFCFSFQLRRRFTAILEFFFSASSFRCWRSCLAISIDLCSISSFFLAVCTRCNDCKAYDHIDIKDVHVE